MHDIKNSLGTLLELIRQLAAKHADDANDDFKQLEFEANRINHSLMQLLVIYKIDNRQFSLAVDEFSAIDVINEAKAQQNALLKLNKVKLDIDCSEDLMCYCDYLNVSNALSTILNNAQRYTKSHILMSAENVGEYIKFCIEDDGDGFPAHLLYADLSNTGNLDWVNGNTGLGLYFVAAIARLHQNHGKNGYVKIDNDSRLGGARFSLFLP